jgi:transposase
MTTIAGPISPVSTTDSVTIGVDTHSQFHVAAALSGLGRMLGSKSFPTTPAGHAALLAWSRGHGEISAFGIEGTGSYGAQLTRDLQHNRQRVFEVDRPDRKARRLVGKDDHLDAEAAARAVLSGRATTIPKARSGQVEAIRTLRIARRTAVSGRTAAVNQLKALLVSGPAELREQLRGLTSSKLVGTCSRLRPGDDLALPVNATKYAMREIAQRHEFLTGQLKRLDATLGVLVASAAPALVARFAIGTDTAGALLVAAGDNPERLRTESSFAHLCGVAPLPCSSGKTAGRYRLNRGGDRRANNALWRIVLVRMGTEQRTKDYVARRTTEGMSKPEIMRCLKRYVAREVYAALNAPSTLNAISTLDEL